MKPVPEKQTPGSLLSLLYIPAGFFLHPNLVISKVGTKIMLRLYWILQTDGKSTLSCYAGPLATSHVLMKDNKLNVACNGVGLG